jgi:hypothetical protein
MQYFIASLNASNLSRGPGEVVEVISARALDDEKPTARLPRNSTSGAGVAD